MKIFVAVPAMEVVKTRFAASFAHLVTRTAMAGHNVTTAFDLFGPLDWKRTHLVQQARAWGADYICWIDSDQTFPEDGLLRLLAHNLPIVGCNIATRDGEPKPTAKALNGKSIRSNKDGGIGEAGAIGLGFCLVQMRVFEAIGAKRLFATIIEDGRFKMSEDAYFCNRAREAGFAIHVDHGLSWEVGHVGEKVYFNSDIGELANADTVLPEAGAG
jgi:hypothetical protein